MMQDEGYTKDEVASILGPYTNSFTLLFVIHYLTLIYIYYKHSCMQKNIKTMQ